jgi:hypothetical protein
MSNTNLNKIKMANAATNELLDEHGITSNTPAAVLRKINPARWEELRQEFGVGSKLKPFRVIINRDGTVSRPGV